MNDASARSSVLLQVRRILTQTFVSSHQAEAVAEAVEAAAAGAKGGLPRTRMSNKTLCPHPTADRLARNSMHTRNSRAYPLTGLTLWLCMM